MDTDTINFGELRSALERGGALPPGWADAEHTRHYTIERLRHMNGTPTLTWHERWPGAAATAPLLDAINDAPSAHLVLGWHTETRAFTLDTIPAQEAAALLHRWICAVAHTAVEEQWRDPSPHRETLLATIQAKRAWIDGALDEGALENQRELAWAIANELPDTTTLKERAAVCLTCNCAYPWLNTTMRWIGSWMRDLYEDDPALRLTHHLFTTQLPELVPATAPHTDEGLAGHPPTSPSI